MTDSAKISLIGITERHAVISYGFQHDDQHVNVEVRAYRRTPDEVFLVTTPDLDLYHVHIPTTNAPRLAKDFPRAIHVKVTGHLRPDPWNLSHGTGIDLHIHTEDNPIILTEPYAQRTPMSFAQTTVVGNAGSDAEYKKLDNGSEVLSVPVAVNIRRQNQDNGEWTTERTDWYKVAYWSKNAKAMAGRIKKGNKIFATGNLKPSAYVRDDGQVNASLDITAKSIEIMSAEERDK